MTTSLRAELHRAGVRLTLHADGLRVVPTKGHPLPAVLRERVTAAKPELVRELQSEARTRLSRIAHAAGVSAALVHALPDDDVAACDGLTDETLRAYLRVLHRGRVMARGEIPNDYTRVSRCEGCGPIWAWSDAPAYFIACPWCFHRKAGRPIPQPCVADAPGMPDACEAKQGDAGTQRALNEADAQIDPRGLS